MANDGENPRAAGSTRSNGALGRTETTRRRGFCLAALFVCLIVSFATPSWSDGIFIPPRAVARVPGVPNQRALIVFRNGVENLAIESSFEGEGNEMAWIIPVPARPTEIARASSGLFTTIEAALQPELIYGATKILPIGMFVLSWGLFMVATGRWMPLNSFLIAAGLLFVVFYGLAMQETLGDNSGPRVGGMRVSDSRAIGDYDVRVLEGGSPAILNEWLAANSFRELPSEGEAIVSDYILRNWSFVVARLRREGGGVCRPHPLMLTFPADAPVYPMRLTQLAHSDLHLELAVIAEQQAVASGMHTTFADAFDKTESSLSLRHNGKVKCSVSHTFGASFALPCLLELAGDSCVITRLNASLSHNDSWNDIRIGFKELRPERAIVYSKHAARLRSLGWGSLTAGCLLLSGLGLCRKQRTPDFHAPAVSRLAIVACSCAAIAYAFVFLNTRQAEIAEEPREEKGVSIGDACEALRQYKKIVSKMSVKEVENYLQDALDGNRNCLTGEPFRVEEAPGGLTVLQDERGIVVRYFDVPPVGFGILGEPVDMLVARHEKPAGASQ